MVYRDNQGPAPAYTPPDRAPRHHEITIDEQLRWLGIVKDADWTPADERERAADLHGTILRFLDRAPISRSDALRFNQLLRRGYANGIRVSETGRRTCGDF